MWDAEAPEKMGKSKRTPMIKLQAWYSSANAKAKLVVDRLLYLSNMHAAAEISVSFAPA